MQNTENSNNLERIKQSLTNDYNKAEAIMLTSKISRIFASGFNSSAGILIIQKNKSVFLTDFRYHEAALSKLQGVEIICIERGKKYSEYINYIFERDCISSVYIEDKTLTVSEYEIFRRDIKADIQYADNLISHLRASKNNYELECMQKAQDIADAVFSELLNKIKPGMTEKQLKAELIYLIFSSGSEGLSFDPIVVSGPNTALPHGKAGDRIVEIGDFITFDFGAVYRDYCSDMTRTVSLGKPSEKMNEVYNIVYEANLLGLEHARSGIAWVDVDKKVREFISSKGYGEFFGHGLGHGIGLEVHESLDYKVEKLGIAPVNGVVTVEPGIYLPGEFGVRIEDCVILKPYGNINMTKSPKHMIILA